MYKEGIRLYLMGIIACIIIINIPEIAKPLQDKLTVIQPQITDVIKANVDNVSAVIVPLVGRISGIPKVVVDGKAVNVDTSDDFSLSHGQSLSVEQIDKILSDGNSPATGSGQYFIRYGQQYKVDAAYLLAIFYQESTLGIADGWYPAGYNVGNIICSGYSKCHGNFRDYSDESNPWEAAIEDQAHLLQIYRDKDGLKTYDEAIAKWAPSSENCTSCYIANSKTMIFAWRNTNKIITNDGGTVIKAAQENGIKVPFGNAQAVSAPITENTGDGFGLNVKAALDANNSALRNITIKDGEQWSFNESVGNPDLLKLTTTSGVYGGGWCDLSCRYVQVFHGLGLHITHGSDINSDDIVFLQHGGIALNNCTVEESPYIWSAGNKGFDNGMQDLIVNNRTGKTIKIAVVDNDDSTATIVGKLE